MDDFGYHNDLFFNLFQAVDHCLPPVGYVHLEGGLDFGFVQHRVGRALALSYLGMLLISLTNPGEFCPFPNAALMVMVFTLAEEATGDVAVPVGEMLGLRPARRIYLPQK